MSAVQTVRFIQACEDPARRLTSFQAQDYDAPVMDRRYQVIESEDALKAALQRHGHERDVPKRFTRDTFESYLDDLRRGRQLVQFEVSLLGCNGESIRSEPLPEDALLAGRFELAALLGHDSHGQVTTAIRKGHLDIVEVEDPSRGTEHYVVCGYERWRPTDKMQRWLKTQERDITLTSIHEAQQRFHAATYVDVDQIAAAILEKQVSGRVIGGRLHVFTAWHYLRWALEQRPGRKELLTRQVTGDE